MRLRNIIISLRIFQFFGGNLTFFTLFPHLDHCALFSKIDIFVKIMSNFSTKTIDLQKVKTDPIAAALHGLPESLSRLHNPKARGGKNCKKSVFFAHRVYIYKILHVKNRVFRQNRLHSTIFYM